MLNEIFVKLLVHFNYYLTLRILYRLPIFGEVASTTTLGASITILGAVSGTHAGLISSLGTETFPSFSVDAVKFILGLGPVQEKCLGLGGCGDALLPSWGKLGEALPPGNVALRLWRLGKTASNSAHQRASSLLAAFTNVTLSGPVRASECGCPVTCSAPVTSNT